MSAGSRPFEITTFRVPADDPKPRSVYSLTGIWQVEPGANDVPPAEFTHTVPVPSLVDIANPSYDWKNADYHWYRTSFKLNGRLNDRFSFLKIDQSQYGTEVWLNGRNLGGTISCYTSHEYNLKGCIDYHRANELVVRVGARGTLPPESAVGKDQEKDSFIPGIWGDVSLVLCGNPRIKLAQVIPHIDTGTAEARITVKNFSSSDRVVEVDTRVIGKRGNKAASEKVTEQLRIGPQREAMVVFRLPIKNPVLWSPDSPFLYRLETTVSEGGKALDQTSTTFGMRRFEVAGSDFLLNGKRIFLKGGNIAFHRFLSDPDRGTLPWNADWIKRVLIDIPKEHNFNFFRNHLGQMYNLWYDIADEYGMLIQNEWQFWGPTGTREQISREFTEWLQDNWNHPSVIIWDPLNESTDDILQKDIVPEMKKLDPTRPWESVDFVEQHPYIYSLGPVLSDRPMGYALSLHEIEQLVTPSVVNEFIWWWLGRDGKPAFLTKEVVERWTGREYTVQDLLQHQAFLAQELVELFRRMRADAIQPFVYLSNSDGPTGNWFLGSLVDPTPKPILVALKNAFASFGISLELWDRHFLVGEQRVIRLFVFNDDPESTKGALRYGVIRSDGKWVSERSQQVAVEASGCLVLPVEVDFPKEEGRCFVRAELSTAGSSLPLAFSQKPAHVFEPVKVAQQLNQTKIVLLDSADETPSFLKSAGLRFEDFTETTLKDQDLFIVGEGMIRNERYHVRVDEISQFVKSGHSMIILEPEFGVDGREKVTALPDLDILMMRREDLDRGGYDSYVFAEDHSHPLWGGISGDHLKIFNGALGGEVVSQHDVTVSVPSIVLARCGLHLKTIAVSEIPYGNGTVILSRLQLRGRLVSTSRMGSLYDRRVDPVAQRYFLNLLSYAGGKNSHLTTT